MDTQVMTDIVVPAVTAAMGWAASSWRNRQRKEADVLSNVRQIIELQRGCINEQTETLSRFRATVERLERRLESRDRSIMKGRICAHVRIDDDCPVLTDVAEENAKEDASREAHTME